MTIMVGNAIGGSVDRLVRWVILPVTSIIPSMVRTGLLFLLFAALWTAFLAALVTDGTILASVQATIGSLPILAQALVWLLFLPLMGGLWAWSTDWPLVIRLAVVLGIAAWNLLTFLPARGDVSPVMQD